MIVTGVAGEKGGLGYFGFSYFEENQDKLKAVEIDGGDGCVAPSVATAQDGTYKPLSRPLFIYVKKDALAAARGGGVPQLLLDNETVDRRGRAVRPAHRRAADEGEGRPRRAPLGP